MGDRGGLATVYMADELAMTGKDVGIFMSLTKSFVLPDDPETDIIMVGLEPELHHLGFHGTACP